MCVCISRSSDGKLFGMTTGTSDEAHRTAVLLGAGASADAGLPMARELTQRALTAAGSRAVRRDANGAVLQFVAAAMQLSDVRQGGSAMELPDIERLVSAVRMLRRSAEA
jgi:hypothetical protein